MTSIIWRKLSERAIWWKFNFDPYTVKLSWETTATIETTCPDRRTTHFWQQDLHFKYNRTCHHRPPVLTDHISVASGVVFLDRFYYTYSRSQIIQDPSVLDVRHSLLSLLILMAVTAALCSFIRKWDVTKTGPLELHRLPVLGTSHTTTWPRLLPLTTLLQSVYVARAVTLPPYEFSITYIWRPDSG